MTKIWKIIEPLFLSLPSRRQGEASKAQSHAKDMWIFQVVWQSKKT